MNTGKAAVAEFFGTFWLVFGGTGAAVLAASVGNSGIGWLGVALAFGLTVVTMAYAVGHISGGHFNPAITIGLWAGGRFPGGKVAIYIVAQVIGGICASAVLYVIASARPASASPTASPPTATATTHRRATARGGDRHRAAAHVRLPARDPRGDRPKGARGSRAARHRPDADAHPPHQHPGGQYLGEPGSLARPGALCRRLGAQPAVGVHHLPDRRRRRRRTCVSFPARGEGGTARQDRGAGRGDGAGDKSHNRLVDAGSRGGPRTRLWPLGDVPCYARRVPGACLCEPGEESPRCPSAHRQHSAQR